MAQLSKENSLQKEAFELYYHMGDKRSLRAVAEKIERTERTVAGWSRAFRLVDSLFVFGEGIPQDYVEVGTNVEYALYVNDGHVQHRRFLPADKLTVGGRTKYLKNSNQKGIMFSERYVNGAFFMEKGMQSAKPRFERLVESFMRQIAREVEGGSL